MVEQRLPKPTTRVRFPSPAPTKTGPGSESAVHRRRIEAGIRSSATGTPPRRRKTARIEDPTAGDARERPPLITETRCTRRCRGAGIAENSRTSRRRRQALPRQRQHRRVHRGGRARRNCRQEIEGKLAGVLESLVIDTRRDHNTQETAKRVAKMYVHEIFRGRYTPPPPVTEFPNVERLNELLIVGPITVRSACSHHLCPIIGKAVDRRVAERAFEPDRPVQVRPPRRLGDEPAADPGRGGHAAGRSPVRNDEARRARHRDGSRPLLHALARRQGHRRPR